MDRFKANDQVWRRLDINPDTGAELEQNVKNIFKLEPALIAKLKEILR